MRSILYVALVALLVGAAAAADADSKVVVLDEKTFDKFVADTPLSLIEFFAPWCGHCKQLAPEFATASNTLAEKPGSATLASVDCTVERALCERFGVQGFPTLKVFRNDGSEPAEYDGPRKADGIVKYMERQNAPAVTTLADTAAVKEFGKTESIKIVAFVNTDAELETFTKVAKSMRNEYLFGAIKGNAEANADNKVTAPAVVIFRDFDEGAVTFTDLGAADADAKLTSFIRAQSFPLIGEIGPENYAKYLDRGFNFVWIFVNNEDEAQKKMLVDITPVAADNRDKLSFVKLDGIRWVEHAKSFGLSGNTPGVVLEARDKKKNFVYPESDAITKDSFGAWISGVLSGTIQPNIKSEAVPEKNDGPVKVIVGKTFDEIVLDDSKDVLVEFYAPWCGHCKTLAPKYDELGKLFKDDNTVVIAKIDATANDSPADVQGFPTIILYPAGDKSNPVNYEGERTVKGMAAFIKANGKAGGRPDASAAAEAGAGGDDAAEHDGHDHDHDGHDHHGHDHGDEL